jgi:hypothetical protein
MTPLQRRTLFLLPLLLASAACGDSRSGAQSTDQPTEVATFESPVTTLAADTTNLYGSIYWREIDRSDIFSVPQGGGHPTVLATVPKVVALAANETGVYWGDINNRVWQVPRTGGDVVSIGSWAGLAPRIVGRDSRVIWRDDTGIVGKSGNESLTQPFAFVEAMVLADFGVYWHDGGRILFGALRGDAAEVIGTETERGSVAALVADDQYVYWVKNNALHRIDKRGGSVSVIWQSSEPVAAAANGSDVVYLLGQTNVYAIGKNTKAAKATFPARSQTFQMCSVGGRVFYTDLNSIKSFVAHE